MNPGLPARTYKLTILRPATPEEVITLRGQREVARFLNLSEPWTCRLLTRARESRQPVYAPHPALLGNIVAIEWLEPIVAEAVNA